ncbi:hypothetical protein JO84_gp346 [Aureococcus anophagefferens virus]|uniref:Uncharacterized protein n=1 Tax=Aureococcus anophagefferens virus TaxID=1474867 RepID=A0A076FGX5_9VIRU|nr:hypothetical protein JO84_gp346 [Aureococcus anophagefferens virus]AII16992.1 hypothetical protein AaV_127 [Aureococcus anophagefferens virus]UOG94425.1 hypothetical protein MKD35_391 [Aureococcus anophagefferens virus]
MYKIKELLKSFEKLNVNTDNNKRLDFKIEEDKKLDDNDLREIRLSYLINNLPKK